MDREQIETKLTKLIEKYHGISQGQREELVERIMEDFLGYERRPKEIKVEVNDDLEISVHYEGTVKAHNYGKMPKGASSYCDVSQSLEDYDLKNLPAGVEEVWYWYATAPYSGSGAILMRKGDEWDTDYLGHCSCYGPLENCTFEGVSLACLMEGNPDSDVDPLIEMARSQGWK